MRKFLYVCPVMILALAFVAIVAQNPPASLPTPAAPSPATASAPAVDIEKLKQVVLDPGTTRTDQERAVQAICAAGDEVAQKALLELAADIRKTMKKDEDTPLILRDISAIRAPIVARTIKTKPADAIVATATPVAGGVEIAVTPPENCLGVLVTVSDGTKDIAWGLVQDKTIKLALPAGKFTATLRPIIPCDADSLKKDIGIASLVIEAEGMLQVGQAVKLESLLAKDKPAASASVMNSTAAVGLDDFAKKSTSENAANIDTGIVVLKGKPYGWPMGDPPGKTANQLILPTIFWKRHGIKLGDMGGSIHLEEQSNVATSVQMLTSKAEDAIVVGQFCKAWDGKSYLFIVFGAWPADVSAASTSRPVPALQPGR